MEKQNQKRQAEILRKKEILDHARIILKQEFIGIDGVIDQIIDTVSSWYLFPDLQEKPVIINLWGLTGVGKSSLVKRLAELIEFDKRHFNFDMGKREGALDHSIEIQFANIFRKVNEFPIILTFDEFQHAKGKDEYGNELQNKKTYIIWQLMDTGKFQIDRGINLETKYKLDTLIQSLKFLLKKGVRVSKGKVVEKKEYFIDQMSPLISGEKKDNSIPFVDKSYWNCILSIVHDRFSTPLEIGEELEKLNGPETINFLQEVYIISNSFETVDCSKGLIFVLGNIDEAYTMTDNLNPDMNADEFYEESLKINVSTIKKALQRRFRNEQIARLGNNHVIYPAFSKESFRKIIKLELSKVAEKFYNQQKIKLEFDATIHDLIYKEGVYPTQGTRPIYSTIHQIINTKIGRIMAEMIMECIEVSHITFTFINNNIIIDYYQKEEKLHSLSFQQKLTIENLRKNKKDDNQAIAAVHESGHAILSAILLRTVPESIFSNTVESETNGYVYIKPKHNYIVRKEILGQLAVFLGGYEAEKIIYGEENITSGACGDIEQATHFITRMLKQCGMGNFPAAYQVKDFRTWNYLHDPNNEINEQAAQWLKKARDLAENTLQKQEVLLLKMANYLSDNRQMNKEEIRQFIEKYAIDFDTETLVKNGDFLFYRKHLKGKMALVEGGIKEAPSMQMNEISSGKKIGES